MPFTLSHPAAAVPLRRFLGRAGDLSALVIGSMAPDFIYYVPVAMRRSTTHTFAALFWFCLPVGVLTYLVFDQILKAPCSFLLPEPLRRRVGPVAPTRLSAARLAAVAVSVLLGATTHLVWDSFTHGNTPLPLSAAFLRIPLASVFGVPVTGFRLLQHASTIGGATILVIWTARWFRAAPEQPQLPVAPFPETARALVLVALLIPPFLVALSGGAALFVLAPPGPFASAPVLDAAITTFRLSVVATLLALLAYGIVWQRRCARQRPATGEP